MTLQTLRNLFYELIFERNTSDSLRRFPEISANRLVNAGLHHVYNLARSVQQSLFITKQDVTVTNAGGARVVFATLPAGFTDCKRIISAYRTNTLVGSCAVQMFGDAIRKASGTAQDFPEVCLYNTDIAVIDAPASIDLELIYIYGLPDMTTDSDTPGEAGGAGQENALPIQYHPMVAIKAAALGLKADRAPDWQGLENEFNQQREQLVASLVNRDDTSENG